MQLTREPQQEMLELFNEWLGDTPGDRKLTIDLRHVGSPDGPVSTFALEHGTPLAELAGRIWARMERHAGPLRMTQKYLLVCRSVSGVTLGQQPFEVTAPLTDPMGDSLAHIVSEPATAAGRVAMGMRHDNDSHRTYLSGVGLALTACKEQLQISLLTTQRQNLEIEHLRGSIRAMFADLQKAQDESSRRAMQERQQEVELEEKLKKWEVAGKAIATLSPIVLFKFLGPQTTQAILPLVQAFGEQFVPEDPRKRQPRSGIPRPQGMPAATPPAPPPPPSEPVHPGVPEPAAPVAGKVVDECGISTFVQMIGPAKKRTLLMELTIAQASLFEKLEREPTMANVRTLWESFTDMAQLARLQTLLSQDELNFLFMMFHNVADDDPADAGAARAAAE